MTDIDDYRRFSSTSIPAPQVVVMLFATMSRRHWRRYSPRAIYLPQKIKTSHAEQGVSQQRVFAERMPCRRQ